MTMQKIFFKADKNLYKANLHCHTTESDGKHTPAEIKRLYRAQGYHIIAFTDHNVFNVHDALNDADFLALNSMEVDIYQPKGTPWSRMKTYHFNLYATSSTRTHAPPLPAMPYHDKAAINQYIADRNAEGFLVCYNHPAWSLQTYEEYSQLKGCFAMEIYNHGCEVEDSFNGYSPQAYDDMLRCGQRLFCLSTDDNHGDGDMFGGWVYVHCAELSYEAIMQALAQGDFYASQGLQIHEISVEDKRLTVKCSPAEKITVFTQGRHGKELRGTNLTEAQFELSGDEGYIRVVCRDANHLDANSNAYFL